MNIRGKYINITLEISVKEKSVSLLFKAVGSNCSKYDVTYYINQKWTKKYQCCDTLWFFNTIYVTIHILYKRQL